jgi:hypothetical protein
MGERGNRSMGAWEHGSMGERGMGILSQGFPVARLTSCSCSKKPEPFTAEDAENAEAGGFRLEDGRQRLSPARMQRGIPKPVSLTRPGGPHHFSPARQGREPFRIIIGAPEGGTYFYSGVLAALRALRRFCAALRISVCLSSTAIFASSAGSVSFLTAISRTYQFLSSTATFASSA